jgi:hypothetical protein
LLRSARAGFVNSGQAITKPLYAKASSGHFMLKGSPEGDGVVLVNGVPRRGGGIRPPLFWTKLLAPESRMMAPAEEYLIPPATSVKIMLPNWTVILINAD